MRRKRPDIIVMGLGMLAGRQVTVETLAAIKQCRVIFHLTHQDSVVSGLAKARVVDLEDLYWQSDDYWKAYEQIIQVVVAEAQKKPAVGLLTYGHPLFFDNASVELVKKARRAGLNVQVLPAVTSLDSLSVELNLSWAGGLQVFEADDFLARKIRPNPLVDLLLMDITHLGSPSPSEIGSDRGDQVAQLVTHLVRVYSPTHRISLVSVADGVLPAKHLRVPLSKLPRALAKMPIGATLYVPAVAS